jgi:hypothetical protein
MIASVSASPETTRHTTPVNKTRQHAVNKSKRLFVGALAKPIKIYFYYANWIQRHQLQLKLSFSYANWI